MLMNIYIYILCICTVFWHASHHNKQLEYLMMISADIYLYVNKGDNQSQIRTVVWFDKWISLQIIFSGLVSELF